MKAKLEDDPVVDQIREIRHQISAEFGHDPRKVLAYYSDFEKKLLTGRVDGTDKSAHAQVSDSRAAVKSLRGGVHERTLPGTPISQIPPRRHI